MSYQSAISTLQFTRGKDQDFTVTLNQRVNQYFRSNNIRKQANAAMVFKTMVMYALFVVPYMALYVIDVSWYTLIPIYMLMGVGMAGLGLSVMHDANHGAYSNKKWLNKLLGYTLNFIGGNATNWKIQHNVFHHTFTNIDTHDEDVRPRFILRFSPHAKRQTFHRFQHVYAWFLYGFMTLSWVLFKDVSQLITYQKTGILKKQTSVTAAWFWFFFTKVFYYFCILALPIWMGATSIAEAVVGFVILHYVAGFILAIVFQPAHVLECTEFPLAGEEGKVEENWTVHQLKTTCNFAMNNRWLSWFVGGLNFQVEHHLFPNICHVHYPKISQIVKRTASEFGVPYHSIPTFWGALVMHGNMLYKLGRPVKA